MITMQGKGVSSGIAGGKLSFYRRSEAEVTDRCAEDLDGEKQRLTWAQQAAVEQLGALADRCRERAGEDMATLFETHAMFVEDEDFNACILGTMENLHCSAEYAVQTAGAQFAAMFSAMDDAYMRERGADILDVSRRLVNILRGTPDAGMDVREPVILAADDLAPSEALQLDRYMIRGIVTGAGSGSSHTAILLRSMGIPAVCGMGEALKPEYAGRMAFVDGETGLLVLDPDARMQNAMEQKQAAQQESRRRMLELMGQEDVTLDGKHIDVVCNIAAPEDVDAVLANDGRGVGLFRSEILFLATDDYPTEEQQFRLYKQVVTAMGGRRVTIRTLDIGADKQAPYFDLQQEANPAMGLRSIRICLNRPEVFRTQLRAVYRASAFGKVAIMFPMVTSLWEVRACKRACEAVMQELQAEGIAFDPNVELGITIETPASVFIAGELAGEVDFFSVGTNDLSQFILACDREHGGLDRFFDAHHPAVLRAVKMAADAAHKAGILVGICGDLAADLTMLPTFLAMGVDEFSVSPASVLPLRAQIRSTDTRQCDLSLLK